MYKSKGIVVDNETTKFKYAPKETKSKSGKPRKIFPDNWISGPDMLRHEMYYAWLKHRSQARYRKEAYELSWEDWQEMWANPIDFQNRGRKPDDLTLTRIDDDGAWELANVVVITRLEQLRKARNRRIPKNK